MQTRFLSWRLSRDRRQDLCDRKRSCLKNCFAILWLFLPDFRHTIIDWKGLRSPKQIATIAVCDPIFHLLSLLLGRDPCGDRILWSCLQKGPATTPANYGSEFCFGISGFWVCFWASILRTLLRIALTVKEPSKNPSKRSVRLHDPLGVHPFRTGDARPRRAREICTFGENSSGFWETDFLPLLVLTRQGRSTGKNQYW